MLFHRDLKFFACWFFKTALPHAWTPHPLSVHHLQPKKQISVILQMQLYLYSVFPLLKKGVQWQNEDVMAFSITGRGGVRGEGACPSLPQNPPPSLPSLCLGKNAGTHLGPWRQTFSKEKAAAVRVRSDLISKRDEHLQH